MTLIKWVLAIPLIGGAVLFALAHPDIVSITWNPFKPEIELPLYFVALSFLGIGFLLGAFMAWIGMGKIRSERRKQRKTIKNLEKDIIKANEKIMEILAKNKPENHNTISHADIDNHDEQ